MNHPSIKDYSILELINEGKHTIIFRAQRKVDGINFIIKLLKSENNIPRNVQILTHEFEILNKLKTHKVVKASKLLPVQDSLLLILEDFPSKTLAMIIEEESLDILKCLDISILIADTVGEIHHEHIIHKDIKPQNILLDREIKNLKIIDFGIATYLSNEMQEVITPEQVEGSIPYISPEQTGRMNSSIDYRADIYSVGVTLYQLFTNRLPFEAESALEIIHSHIALKPIPPHERDPKIPKAISDIILKCLEKQPDHRYHSAYGLKKDLEKCRELLIKTSEISYFQPGQEDVYDHFHYPENLYGRKKELNIINQVFVEVLNDKSKLLVLRGYSGIGKTRLVQEAQKQISAKEGRFASAKFDQFKKNIPYNGWIQAFKIIIHQILAETDENLDLWRDKIREAIGQNGQIIVDIIPEVTLIIGEQPPLEKLKPLENENRFIYTLTMFLKSLLVPERPLVILFDDVQWGDEPSLKILTHFFKDPAITNFLVIIAYRENEIDSTNQLPFILKDIELGSNVIQYLPLNPLSQEAIEELIHDAFFGPPKQTKDLSHLLYRKTQGNPFFTLQYLKYLNEQDLFKFSKDHACWVANLDAISREQVSDNVADLLINNLKRLEPNLLNLLKTCAATESEFSAGMVAKIMNVPEKDLLPLFEEGLKEDLISYDVKEPSKLVSRDSSKQSGIAKYRFLHNRIQQAAYSLLTEGEKHKLHYKIGNVLLKAYAPDLIKDNCSEIVNHLNLTDFNVLTNEEKDTLVKLNLMAGLKAKDSVAYLPAIEYFLKGISLLRDDFWTKQYEIALQLNTNLALCLQVIGSVKLAKEYFDICLEKAKTQIEKADTYFQIITLDSQIQNYDSVIENAYKSMEMLNVRFVAEPSRISILKDLLTIKFRMLFRKAGDLEKKPLARDPKALAVARILGACMYPAYVTGRKTLFLKMALQMVDLTIDYGVLRQSSVGLSAYAMVLGSNMLNDFKASTEIGLSSLNVSAKFPKTEESAGSAYIYYAFIFRWQNLLKHTIEPLKKNYKDCLETGLLNVAAASAVYINLINLITGTNLEMVLKGINENINQVANFKAIAEQISIAVHREFCLCLKGEKVDPTNVRPPELTDELLSAENTNKNLLYELRYNLWHVVALYFFGKYEEGIKISSEQILTKTDNYPNWIEWHIFYFYHALTLAAVIKDTSKQSKAWNELQKDYDLLKKWAIASPLNYGHYELIVRAEVQRIQKNQKGLLKIYEMAVDASKANGTVQDIAIAYELLGNYYIREDSKELSSFFLQKALQFYIQWGAHAKVLDFKNKYSEHLSLQAFSMVSQEGSFYGTTLKGTTLKTTYGTTRNKTNSANPGDKVFEGSEFDVNALIESSQSLSKEIVLDKVIESLMHLVMLHAGADKAFLILNEDGKLMVYSESFINQKYVPVLSPYKVEEKSDELCVGIVKFTGRTRTELLLNNAPDEGNFRYDPYILKNTPKSILSLPLIHKGALIGILYLENSETKGAFTPYRLRLLSLLSSQMAISIENAQFYAKLESKVQDRTHELQKRNQELQEALKTIQMVQQQMIQQEKLASLGLLTSGIAHELKNPLNFVINFSQIAHENMEELKKELQDKGIDESQVAILAELKDNLSKIDTHGKRADGIIKGMLAHAHQGSEKAETIDLNALIEQAVNLTYQTYRKKDARFNVTLGKHFQPNLDPIEAYTGDLIRVFINIIDNSFYALLEKIKSSSEEYKPTLNITTKKVNDKVVVNIRDNGPGIPKSAISKIFQPFYTTKPTGSGTGLGLSIVYDVITKQHGGLIEVHAEPNLFTEFVITLPLRIGIKEGSV